MEDVLAEMQEVSTKDDSEIGNVQDFQMRRKLADDILVTASYWQIPPHLYKEVENYIDDPIANGWVRESVSPIYRSPIVVGQKKDGSMGMCIDYRFLNLITVPDAQPIPKIQDTLGNRGTRQGKPQYVSIQIDTGPSTFFRTILSKKIFAQNTGPWQIFHLSNTGPHIICGGPFNGAMASFCLFWYEAAACYL